MPLLIIIRTVFDAAGKPDIAGFLFEEGTLIHDPDEPRPPPQAGLTGAPGLLDRPGPP